MSTNLPPEAIAFREQFYKELAETKKRLVADLNARFRNANFSTPDSAQYYFNRYEQEMFEINRVYGRTGSEIHHYLIAFGDNDNGQLGAWDPNKSFLKVEKFSNCRLLDAGSSSGAVLNDGRPYAWGSVTPEQDDPENTKWRQPVFGFPQKDDMKIVDLALGDAHCIYLGMSGDVYSTGFYKDEDSLEIANTGSRTCTVQQDNDQGSQRYHPQKIDGFKKPAEKVFANASMAAAILVDKSLVTWGKFPFPMQLIYPHFSQACPIRVLWRGRIE